MLLNLIKKAGLAASIAMSVGFSAGLQADTEKSIDVYRDPNCGCCTKWITYLKDKGYTVVDHEEENMSAVKEKLGVPANLGSCHTGVVNGKFVEGHVAVEQIAELTERSDLIGAAAPGMPMGSPGMESGGRRSAYQVMGLTKSGNEVILADFPAQ